MPRIGTKCFLVRARVLSSLAMPAELVFKRKDSSFTNNWVRAETECRKIGGHLASVHAPRENDYILQLVRTERSATTRFWIGGNNYVDDVSLFFWFFLCVVQFLGILFSFHGIDR